MKTTILSIVSAVTAVALSNCTAPTGPNTQNGALTGALLGGAAGGIIGHQSGRTGEGAALGAIAGGSAGAIYGNQKDQREYNRRY